MTFPCTPEPRQPTRRDRGTRRAHQLAHEVQHLGVYPPARVRVAERVEVDVAEVRAAARRRDHARVLVRGRARARGERGEEELGEVEVAEDVGAPLQIVPVEREVLDRRVHRPAARAPQLVSQRARRQDGGRTRC